MKTLSFLFSLPGFAISLLFFGLSFLLFALSWLPCLLVKSFHHASRLLKNP